MGPDKSFTGLEIGPAYDKECLGLEEVRWNDLLFAKMVKYLL